VAKTLQMLGKRGQALPVLLACALALQTMPRPLAGQEQPKPRLNIVIVEGEGAINNIRQRTAREPIVRVEDENHRPLAGASVVFLLPDSGASGVFANGTRMLTAMTDQQGRAVATGLRPNNIAGKFQIRVNATYQGMTGNATIAQTNAMAAAAAAGGVSGKLLAIIAVAGGAAAGGAILATRGGKATPATPSTPPPSRPTVSISAGTPSVGAPR
jgi:hypothetical protein